MKNTKQIERWSPWLLLVAVLLLWQIVCAGFEVSDFIFPSPWRIWTQFWEYKEIIAGHAWRTFWVTMAGFGLAIVVGVLMGFMIGSSRIAYAAIYPLMTAFNALPKAAFVPILVVWFGIGAGPAILTAFLISFFPIMVNIATGLATLEPELEDVLRVLGAKRWDVLMKIGLPRSMPYFFGSLKVAITLAFVGTTVSEMTAANEGHRLPADFGRLGHADGPGLRGTDGGGRDGDADIRTLQRDREAHHRLGALRFAEPIMRG